jgi:hypothetical protein
MLVRWLVLALLLPVLLIAGCGGDGEDGGGTTTTVGAAQAIAGDWTGHLTQKGLAPFRIGVRIDADGMGRVAYTGIECGGNWALKKALASLPSAGYEFREDITQGAGDECKGTGKVAIAPIPVSPAPKKLGYGFTGGGVSSEGTLHRTDAAGLKPVFDEAGVTPP